MLFYARFLFTAAIISINQIISLPYLTSRFSLLFKIVQKYEIHAEDATYSIIINQLLAT